MTQKARQGDWQKDVEDRQREIETGIQTDRQNGLTERQREGVKETHI